MEVTSLTFGIIALISIYLFYLLNNKYRIPFLLLLSCCFILSFSPLLLVYLFVYSILNYFFGICLPNNKYRESLFRIGIAFNLLQLVILKYSSFALDPFLYLINPSFSLTWLSKILVPVGISYFTLQGIGYLVNIKMGWEMPEKKFMNFFLYLMFFPKFLSGPIERSNHFLQQISTTYSFKKENVVIGLRIALFGLFKKIAIADQLAGFINTPYSSMDTANGSFLLYVFILQPLYLYFDFSGYTDIALGLSKAFGLDLLPNFNKPFFSTNVTTFWKKFHISLSSWFNDYVFKQISFRYRRWGNNASSFGVLVTFILFGIWHGAGWNFMFLGILQALAIIFEYNTKKWRNKIFALIPDFLRIWSGRVITYLFFCISLVFFFSPDLKTALTLFMKLFYVNDSSQMFNLSSLPLGSIGLIFIFLTLEFLENDYLSFSRKLYSFWNGDRLFNHILRWGAYYVAIITVLVLGAEAEQFIYFKF